MKYKHECFMTAGLVCWCKFNQSHFTRGNIKLFI